jgi:hypothetical protein
MGSSHWFICSISHGLGGGVFASGAGTELIQFALKYGQTAGKLSQTPRAIGSKGAPTLWRGFDSGLSGWSVGGGLNGLLVPSRLIHGGWSGRFIILDRFLYHNLLIGFVLFWLCRRGGLWGLWRLWAFGGGLFICSFRLGGIILGLLSRCRCHFHHLMHTLLHHGRPAGHRLCHWGHETGHFFLGLRVRRQGSQVVLPDIQRIFGKLGPIRLGGFVLIVCHGRYVNHEARTQEVKKFKCG